jgi:hypothetical protein
LGGSHAKKIEGKPCFGFILRFTPLAEGVTLQYLQTEIYLLKRKERPRVELQSGCPIPKLDLYVGILDMPLLDSTETALASKQDPYKILNVDKNANDAEIGKAFRKLSRENHPDKHPEDTAKFQKKFQEINTAYGILKEHDKRDEYDNRVEEFEEIRAKQPQDPSQDPLTIKGPEDLLRIKAAPELLNKKQSAPASTPPSEPLAITMFTDDVIAAIDQGQTADMDFVSRTQPTESSQNAQAPLTRAGVTPDDDDDLDNEVDEDDEDTFGYS